MRNQKRENGMKTKVLLAVTLLAGFAVSAQAATIVGSKHDLSYTNVNKTANSIYSNGTNQTCVFCHAPHNAVTNKLLWNRNSTGMPATMSIYTSYNSTAMRQAAGVGRNAGNTADNAILGSSSTSLLCLSCHALATAANVISNVNTPSGLTSDGGSGAWLTRTGSMNNLTNDHPVGIDYNKAQAVDPTNFQGAPTGNKIGTLRLFSSPLGADTMECATCHNVHGSGNPKFLAIANDGSALCVTCHKK